MWKLIQSVQKGNGGSLQHFPRGFCRKLAAIRSQRVLQYYSVAGKKVSSLEGCLLEGTKLEVVEMSLKIRGSSSREVHTVARVRYEKK